MSGFVSADNVFVGQSLGSREDFLHFISDKAAELGVTDDASAVYDAFVAREEMGRLETRGAERGQRVRGEILGLLGDLLGLTPEQRAELASEEGQQRMRENAERFENQLREALSHLSEHDDVPDGGRQTPGMPPHHYPFFSQN